MIFLALWGAMEGPESLASRLRQQEKMLLRDPPTENHKRTNAAAAGSPRGKGYRYIAQ